MLHLQLVKLKFGFPCWSGGPFTLGQSSKLNTFSFNTQVFQEFGDT